MPAALDAWIIFMTKLVTNDVGLLEVDEVDAVYTFQDALGIDEAGFFAMGQIHLGEVAVTTAFEPKPWRVRNIFICSRWCSVPHPE